MYTKKIYFSGGSFHELQEVFAYIHGVVDTHTGYIGAGELKISYEAVVNGTIKAVMGLEVCYDPKKIDISTLMDVLFTVSDPYAKDGQGRCRGPMYQSGVYYSEAEDVPVVELYMNFVASHRQSPAVPGTGLTLNDTNSDLRFYRKCYAMALPLHSFQRAEEGHQHYLRKHPGIGTFIDFSKLRELHVVR
jgi:peptide-methionine (S)-S-oxide reductase